MRQGADRRRRRTTSGSAAWRSAARAPRIELWDESGSPCSDLRMPACMRARVPAVGSGRTRGRTSRGPRLRRRGRCAAGEPAVPRGSGIERIHACPRDRARAPVRLSCGRVRARSLSSWDVRSRIAVDESGRRRRDEQRLSASADQTPFAASTARKTCRSYGGGEARIDCHASSRTTRCVCRVILVAHHG